ncbi:MAG: putative hydro-lyase [Parvibaculaceae bacterium]
MNSPTEIQIERNDLLALSPRRIRELTRDGSWRGTSEGLARGYAQANLVILPKKYALDFILFCLRNPKPCPLVAVTDPGSSLVKDVAPGADLRSDLAQYCVYRDGRLIDEPHGVDSYWREDLVCFLIGCSYSFETALLNAGIPLRHQQENKIVSVYVTNLECVPAGQFHGPMAVSMRPIKHSQVARAVQVTSRFPATHGAPIHIGDPSLIGVDLNKAAFGTSRIDVHDDEVPVFWGCGCTPQAVALASKPDLMITHKAGYLFITDLLSEALAAF